jgi:hypothetical protein
MLLTQNLHSSGTHCSLQQLASPITDSNDKADLPAVSLNLHGLSYTRRQAYAQRLSIATSKGHDDSATAAAPVFLSPASDADEALARQKLNAGR